MSYLATDSLFPEWKVWTQFLDESIEGLRLDALEGSHPIEVYSEWGSPRNTCFRDPVINKVAKRLDGWKRAFLLKGGRLTLIETILSAIPTYYLSFFFNSKKGS